MDPVVLYYGKGQLSGFLADPEGVLDVVSSCLSFRYSTVSRTCAQAFVSNNVRRSACVANKSNQGPGGHGGERDAGVDGEARRRVVVAGRRDARVPRVVVDGEPAGVRRAEPVPVPALHAVPLQRRGGAAHPGAPHAALRQHGPVRRLRGDGRAAALRAAAAAALAAGARALRQVRRAGRPPGQHLPALHLLRRPLRQRQHGGAPRRHVGGGEGALPLRRPERRLGGLHHQRPHPGAPQARHEGKGRRRRQPAARQHLRLTDLTAAGEGMPCAGGGVYRPPSLLRPPRPMDDPRPIDLAVGSMADFFFGS